MQQEEAAFHEPDEEARIFTEQGMSSVFSILDTYYNTTMSVN
jgi:hypothetical protein